MSAARALGRALLWPIRRILDPRFADVTRRVEHTRAEVQAARTHLESVSEDVDQVVETYTEASTFVGTELRDLRAELAAIRAALDEATVRNRLAALAGGTVTDLDTLAADVLNYAGSHRGYAAQRHLWFNPPLVVAYGEGDVRLANVNERIVEVPFALRALGAVPVGARVLDFGAAESTMSLSLATLGYDVTALDLKQYPLAHDNVTAIVAPIEDWAPAPGSFDAVLCISTVEHVGLGWYGDPTNAPRGDINALGRLREALKPGGLLVLTVPYGRASVDDVQRRYDRAGLDRLLEGWDVGERMVMEQRDDVTWVQVEDSTRNAVALVAARKPPSV